MTYIWAIFSFLISISTEKSLSQVDYQRSAQNKIYIFPGVGGIPIFQNFCGSVSNMDSINGYNIENVGSISSVGRENAEMFPPPWNRKNCSRNLVLSSSGLCPVQWRKENACLNSFIGEVKCQKICKWGVAVSSKMAEKSSYSRSTATTSYSFGVGTYTCGFVNTCTYGNVGLQILFVSR